jgi:hypothetical protein
MVAAFEEGFWEGKINLERISLSYLNVETIMHGYIFTNIWMFHSSELLVDRLNSVQKILWCFDRARNLAVLY